MAHEACDRGKNECGKKHLVLRRPFCDSSCIECTSTPTQIDKEAESFGRCADEGNYRRADGGRACSECRDVRKARGSTNPRIWLNK